MKITERVIAKRILMGFIDRKLINENMYDDLVRCRTVDDFVFCCISKNDIPFKEFPNEYRRISFLQRCLDENGINVRTKKDIKKYVKAHSVNSNLTTKEEELDIFASLYDIFH